MDALKSLGLNSYERKLFVALLSRGTSTAGELSEISGVPRSRTYDVLESLAEKGFAIIQTNKPLRYVAVPPSEALERLKRKHEQDFKSMAERIERIKKNHALKELEQLHRKGVKIVDPGEMTGMLKGRYQMLQQMESMIKNAKESLNLLVSEKTLEELANNYMNALKNAARRGVKIRIAAPIKTKSEMLEALSEIAEIRKIRDTNLQGRIAISDGTELLMALTHDEEVHPTQDIFFWGRSEHAAGSTMTPFFEMVWENSEPLN